MLSFERKRQIFRSFPELTEVPISYGRINYVFENSRKPRKVLARELYKSGNGYVYGGYLNGEYPVDDRGWVNIKHFSESELRTIIRKAIDSMSKY